MSWESLEGGAAEDELDPPPVIRKPTFSLGSEAAALLEDVV
jgi:hypothetical protein